MSAPTPDTVREALEQVYGSGPMVTSLASHIVDRWADWEADTDEDQGLHYRLHMEIWNWFAGGGTAEIAADRVLAAVETD